MYTPADYVALLTRKGVKLWVDDGEIRYHAKRGVLSAEELMRLRSMKSEIMSELTRVGVAPSGNPTSARAVGVTEAPASFQQRWFLKSLEEYPNWRATLSYTLHVEGPLDPRRLERSLESILLVHGSLRTKFVHVRGQWLQQIEAIGRYRLSCVSVSGESGAQRRENALALVKKTGSRELDPSVAPLLSAQLIQVSALEHFLVVLIHRLATDCLGMAQVLRELWASYAQTVEGNSSTGSSASASYRDYALWQHSTDGEWRQRHAAYWNDYLAGVQALAWTEETCSSPANREGSAQLASLESSFGETLSGRLRELSRRTRTLPALVMLTLYISCASKWCRQNDLAIPFVIAGRAAVHEGLVGCFSHIVYLRIRLKGDETFAERLKLVSNEFYRAAAFRQDCGRMAAERPELLRGTLCQWLSWHPAEVAQMDNETSLLGLEVKTIRCQSLEELTNAPTEVVDLEMNFFDAAGEISALVIYRTSQFRHADLAELMRDLREDAEEAVRDLRVPS